MALLATQQIVSTGLNPSMVAAGSTGDQYTNDDRTFLVVDNASLSSINVTINVQRASFNLAGFGDVTFANIVVAVPAGAQRYIKAPTGPYSDGNGRVNVDYSASASVTVAAVKMPGG